jgi:RNA polymerase sigma factor (sigma-70 family)
MPNAAKQFEGWWIEVEPTLLRVLTRIVGVRAVDIAQDVAVLALRNFDRFGSYGDFARWCIVRGKWLALDELGRMRAHPEEPIESVQAHLVADERSELADILPLIEQLPDRQRSVVLYKLMGYRTDEIAGAMAIAESAVRSHWRFAQQSLAKKMRDI